MHKEEVIRKRSRVRLKPEAVARQYVRSATDNTSCLEARHINLIKGRGVFALSPLQKGDFVVEYRGEMIDSSESQARRKAYLPSQAVFMFDFHWNGKQWSIDAAAENSSFGRLVNDAHFNPNCRMKKIVVDGKPHLVLFALKNIERGDEITYDYGESDWPWRVYENNIQELMKCSNTSVKDINEFDGGHSTSVAFEHSDQELMKCSNTSVKDINEVYENNIQELMECSNTSVKDINEVSPSILKVAKKPMNSLVDYTDSEVSSGPDFSSDLPSSSIQHLSSKSTVKGEHVPQLRTKSILMDETLNWSEELFDSPESLNSSTDEEEDNVRKIVPNLRKSRSILVNQKISVGSEKISESSQDSGEEYVPSTSGET